MAVVDANGNTNYFSGLVGRDGIFWVENVPFNTGTNWLALTLSNSAGSTTTNFTLIQSSIALSVNAVQAGDTTVSGAIGTNGYTVWVNGVQAAQDSGTWTAQIAPVGIGGGLVEVMAIPNTDNGGNGSGGGLGVNPYSAQSINTQATVEPPAGRVYAVVSPARQFGFNLGSAVVSRQRTDHAELGQRRRRSGHHRQRRPNH